ncbi:hypothetical protein L1987_55357 [Smallanthus sonchifolius]|uniref:Uncharacterized protein n=1 Tax=Smallanthus sonchifolius TaxID=185202 RepID=A0ACB9E9G7_9ASTR|nr:hypothetical protein L1987_55357 [Smallanthus sonchifolius]
MRSFSAFFVVFSLLLLASPREARKDPEEYSRSVMKPKTIEDALTQDSLGSNDKENKKGQFTRDFDAQPNLKMFTKGFNPIPDQFVRDFDTQPNLKMFTKGFNPIPNSLVKKPPMKN